MNINNLDNIPQTGRILREGRAVSVCEKIAHAARRIFDAIADFFRSFSSVFAVDARNCLFPPEVEIAGPPAGITIAQPPNGGIKVGMPNFIFKHFLFTRSGNTCWFNSLMKFIAATDFFDDWLDPVASDDDDEKQVRDRLRALIHTLRTPDKGVIKTDDYLALLEVMKKVPGFENGIGVRQCDPDEFLRSLCGYLNFRSIPEVRLLNDDGVSIPEASYLKITHERFNDGFSGIKPLFLPEKIIVSIERGRAELRSPLSAAENGIVHIPLYHEDSTPNGSLPYRIVAGVERLGSSPASGHYISWEKTGDQNVVRHNDRTVSCLGNRLYTGK